MFLDTSYDHVLSAESDLHWLPWIGESFQNSPIRTMIIGESVYDWNPDDQKVIDRIIRKDSLRVLHKNHAMNLTRNSKYVRNIERALFGKKTPSEESKQNLWKSVVYHNLVLRPMSSLKERPTYKDYLNGWQVVLKLITILELQECVVYGLESQKIKSLREFLSARGIPSHISNHDRIGRFLPKTISFSYNEATIKLVFIRHPSSFFSWRKWHYFLRQELQLGLHEINQELTT